MAMFAVLDQAAAVEHIEHVEITFRAHGGDIMTVTYGAQCEAAIVRIVPAEAM